MKRLAVIWLLAVCCISAARLTCPLPKPGRRQVPKVRGTSPTHFLSVVHIANDCNYCTGWVIKPGVFITASHCFETPTHATLAVFEDGYRTPLHLVRRGDFRADASQDIAILTGDTHQAPPIESEVEWPLKGFLCSSLGYGMEGTQKAAACMGAEHDWDGTYRFAGQVDFGDSGGPVVALDGRVLGIQVAIDAHDMPTFYVIHVANVLEMLRKEGL